MAEALSNRTIDIVKATVPALEKGGTAVTDRMYQRLFRTPEIRDLFNQSHHGETGSQSKALTAAIIAYGRNIDNLGVLASRVERITQKHVGLNILPEHYPYVADALLGAIKDVLGDAATDEVLDAWGEAYWFLADVLKAREASVYAGLAAAPGGWNGWRDFTVESVTPESDIIRSFILVPADERGVIRHRPGQYLTFALDVPGAGVLKRNYSISSAPDSRSYRISVKREEGLGRPAGLASNWLHDHAKPGTVLKVAPPAGEFFLDEASAGPVVLLSGGVGLTPMMSMLENIAGSGDGRPTWYIHGAENGRVHAMRDHSRALAAQARNITLRTYYNAPDPADVQGRDYDERGFISMDWIVANTPTQEAAYYLCGPRPFLRAMVGGLAGRGVPLGSIHYEFFGPADELLAV
ncbi:dihydropteridine reductase (plasmid) [Azospirillum argentinense]|uniref:Flavohemoprotein n=1 Tax=Azospirillum argentinense TaxID=2970906 RepID=A0A060DWH1_9PROT|nr:NO-inducible flavohemoprotein [Azospirillum argentinense]AIB15433.1 dihydropteridine reductase [Azospirillum argentinense]EZQ04221.1 dihydropteridine reductase [Azospirillum argentinense]PNQ94847.1 NO-inducible flavohemoprotein [Azospirillum argentinense]